MQLVIAVTTALVQRMGRMLVDLIYIFLIDHPLNVSEYMYLLWCIEVRDLRRNRQCFSLSKVHHNVFQLTACCGQS